MTLIATDTAAHGMDLRGIRNPHALVKSWLRHNKLTKARDVDDIESDLFYGIARGVSSWSEDGGATLVSWCWVHMHHEFVNGRVRRARHDADRLISLDDIDEDLDPAWVRIAVTDHGFEQVEDRLTIQRWAEMAHLTDAQAAAIALVSVHHGTHAKRERAGGPARERSPITPAVSSNMRAGVAKLRRVAATGQPWARTFHVPKFTLDDVRTAVAG